MSSRKDLKDLNLADDFMFGKVMGQERLAKQFIEYLFGKPIYHISKHVVQSEHNEDYDSHGTRFDVEFVGDDVVYDIEMQQSGSDANPAQKELFNRVRYYQSTIDRSYLAKGCEWEDLPDSRIIFICTFDPFGKGHALYKQVSALQDVIPGVEVLSRDLHAIDNGTMALYLNTKYTVQNVPSEIVDFLFYIDNPDVDVDMLCPFIQDIHEEVCNARVSEQNRRDYMSLTEMMKKERREAQREDDELFILSLMEEGRSRSDAEAFVRQMRERATGAVSKSRGLQTMQLGG